MDEKAQPTCDEPTASLDQARDPLPVTIGRYQIVERIGAGGMGTVYKAHDPHLNRTVALKLPTIDTTVPDRPKRMERFQREARSAAQVWHPHVCPIYDVGEHEGQPYVVMAYVEGQSLAERLAQRGRFEDVGQAVTLILQVLDALGAVHGHGIVHRDMKPSNIMLDAGGRAVLMDFGLARPENDAERLTSEGVIVGTPAYMAPEQAAGRSQQIGPWTDLYSAGVVFFEMLTGRLPFEGAPLALLGKILHDPPPPVSLLRPYLDPRLDLILCKALDKEPEGRFREARHFRDALAALALAVPTITLPQATPVREEVPKPQSLLNAVGERDRKLFQSSFFYLFVAAWFAVAAICLVIHVASNDSSARDRAILAMFGALAIGGIPLYFAALGQWDRNRELTSRNRQGMTFLMTAARDGHVSQVKDLLARGADANEKDKNRQTALMKAAQNGHTTVVKLLLAGGAEVNEENNEGQTALQKAKAAGHSDIVRLLEDARAKGHLRGEK